MSEYPDDMHYKAGYWPRVVLDTPFDNDDLDELPMINDLVDRLAYLEHALQDY